MIVELIRYYLTARNLHGTHSPFIYNLYSEVFNKDIVLPSFFELEKFRNACRKNNTKVNFRDFGAGGVKNPVKTTTVAQIAKNSLKRPKWARAFYRLVSSQNLETIVELGTSLGVTTSYLALANPKAKIYSFEGSSEVLQVATQFFEAQNLTNISTIQGNIDDTLTSTLEEIANIDLLFIDANHRFEPTIRYFETCFSKLHENSVVIFDDIYWSKEMKKAWSRIKKDDRVFQTIDLFEIGIAFFRQNQAREHFVLKY